MLTTDIQANDAIRMVVRHRSGDETITATVIKTFSPHKPEHGLIGFSYIPDDVRFGLGGTMYVKAAPSPFGLQSLEVIRRAA